MAFRGDQSGSKSTGRLRHIGTSPPRPDGVPKAAGSHAYADDWRLEGMYWGATLRSPHAHARIHSVTWHQDRAPEGAVCVTAADLKGPNGVLLIKDDWPILAEKVVRHVGEPVALVAAPSKQAARAALAAVEVEYQRLQAILDLESADEEEPLARLGLDHGDVEGAFAEAHLVVEGTYQTGYQEHIYIECQAMTGWLEEDGTVVVKGSMQCPYFVHKSVKHALELSDEKVRVIGTPVGGGFGGKEDYPSVIALHTLLLAQACGHPVRIAYDRHEDIICTTKRHPSRIKQRTAVDAEGHLTAMDIEIILDGGAYTTLSPVVLSRAVLHAAGPYRCPNVRIRGRVLRTNTATNGAFRGFGAPQAQFATERQMDRIARQLRLDPLEIRLRNVLEAGDSLPTGQVLDDSTAARICLQAVARNTDFRKRWSDYEKRRGHAEDGAATKGLGLSLYFHGAGFTGNGERTLGSRVSARLLQDGRIEVLTAAVEMGQGCDVLFPMLACEASGLRVEDVVIAEPDTASVPDSGPSVASRTSMIVGSEVAAVVKEMCDQVVGWWLEQEGWSSIPQIADGVVRVGEHERSFREMARELARREGGLKITRKHEPPAWQVFDDGTYQGVAYPTYAWGADVVELSVDPDTLETRLDKATAVCEVGRVLHPTLCRGQIEGGTLQALGWALMEEIKVEDGRYLNDRMATYIIPTFKDSPEIDVLLLEKPWNGGLVGAKGVGELPMDGGAPAVAAAMENATGIEVDTIPATPERLFAWQQKGQTIED
jgi:CO/xanthine dehydrogenase Mo-binding subunit